MNLDEALAVKMHFDEVPRHLTPAEQTRYDHAREIVANYAESTGVPAPKTGGAEPENALFDGALTADQWRMAAYLAVAFLIGALVGFGAATRANAFDNGQYGDVPESIRSWYKGVKAKSGVPCCDIADGHKTAFRVDAEGRYEVPIDGEWRSVPPEAVIYDAGNPEDMAIVWYVRQGVSTYYIRCFVPVGGA